MTTPKKKQIDRFRETAREIGADESDDAPERVFKKIDPENRPEPKKTPTKWPGLPKISNSPRTRPNRGGCA